MRRSLALVPLAASLFAAGPALAQGAPERVAHCLHAAVTSLATVGAAAEQLAPVALSRCYDEIQAVLKNVKAEAVRIALLRELHDYTVDIAGRASLYTEASSVTREAAPPAF